MTNTTALHNNHEIMDAADYVNDSYFNYSMYSILDRAMPSVTDGLKPVHRRLIYAMHHLNLDPTAKYKKSARTVGDTLGKYHPHGDTACYEAMVLMAQPFSTRHPLVDGQGNWGSLDDPHSFAAMRYTEAKLTRYSQLLLDELKFNTVEYSPNFDGSLTEPQILPAQVPNILINGVTGIAVGITSEIPPHNLAETIDHCITYLSNPSILPEDLLAAVVGPDFPTGGVVVSPRSQIMDAYRTGQGNLIVRSGYRCEGSNIIIESLPFRVKLGVVLAEIAEQIESKALPQVLKIVDETDRENPLRLVLHLRSNRVDPDEVMSHLFATTKLQSNVRFNFNIIDVAGSVSMFSYYKIIRQWCEFRQDIFEKKKRHRLSQIERRFHILDGLLIAYSSLDEVIRIIREEDDAKLSLMSLLRLSEIQAQAILDLRLKQLAKLEEGALRAEYAELEKEADALRTLLSSDRKIKNAVIKELELIKKSHAEPRRTLIQSDAPAAQKIVEKPQPGQPVTVVFSEQNWVRMAQGHDVDIDSLPYKTGDKPLRTVKTDSLTPVLVLDTTGRFYSISPADLPQGKSASEPLSKHLTMPAGATVFWVGAYTTEAKLLLCSAKGNAFITPMEPLASKVAKGKEVWKFAKEDSPLFAEVIGDRTHIATLSSDHYLGIIDLSEINESMKSQGIKTMNLPGNLSLASVSLCDLKTVFTLRSGQSEVKVTTPSEYVCSRARRGLKVSLKRAK